MTQSDFLLELKDQFERYIHLKERLDNKANNMIAMSGTIAVIFMGFGAFLFSDIIFTKNYFLPIITILVFMSEVILTFFTIKFALDSYKLRTYNHPISFKAFYEKDSLEESVVQQFRDADSSEINEHFIKEYLESIKSYEEQNDHQTRGINKAQICFVGSIVMISVFAFFIILSKFFST